MLKEYTTKKIMELCEECGNDKKFMNKVWIAKEIFKERKNKIVKYLTKIMDESIDEAKRLNEEGHKSGEHRDIGIATGLALAIKKIKKI